MNNTTSEKIVILRPILIFLIVATHIPGSLYRPDLKDIELSLGNFLNALLSGSIAVSALPLLSVISGYLAGRTYERYSYSNIIKNKARRLLIPLLFWNLLLAVLIYQSQAKGLPRRPDLLLYPFSIENWVYALFSIIELPANQPLYFLKELFLCFTILPVLYFISKNRLLTLIALSVVAYMSLNNINMNQFFHRIDIYGFFIIGLFIYNNKIKIYGFLSSLTAGKIAACVFAYSFTVILLTYFMIEKNSSSFVFYIKALTVIGPVVFWLASDFIVGSLKRFFIWLSPAAFPVFLGHILVLNLYWDEWSSYYKATPFDSNYQLFWVSSMVLCFVVMGSLAVVYRRVVESIKKQIF